MKNLNESQKTGLLFFLTMLVYQGIGGVVSVALSKYTDDIHVQILISQFFIVIFPVIWYFRTKENIVERFRMKKLKPALIPLLILATALLYPFLSLINVISAQVVQSQSEMLGETMMSGGILLNILLVALLPCMVEELVCRGMLLSGYRQISRWTGILLSAFLFGCMHLNLNQFIYTFVFGIYLALMVEITGSIFASMLCHFTLNGSSVILVNLFAKDLTESLANQGDGIAMESILVFAMIAGVCLVLLMPVIRQIMKISGYDKSSAKEELSIRREKGKLLEHIKMAMSPSLVLVIAFCFFVMIFMEVRYLFY